MVSFKNPEARWLKMQTPAYRLALARLTKSPPGSYDPSKWNLPNRGYASRRFNQLLRDLEVLAPMPFAPGKKHS